jgi:hypothetical protein
MNSANPNSDSGGIFRLIYRSRNRIVSGQRKTELGSLFSTARAKNKRLNIAGGRICSAGRSA